MAYTVNVLKEKCVGCSLCTRICPTGTLTMDKQTKKAYTTDIICDNAWGCLYACPTGALEIVEAHQ
jgi:Fe-S-cluster-containing hydrogenase component 2